MSFKNISPRQKNYLGIFLGLLLIYSLDSILHIFNLGLFPDKTYSLLSIFIGCFFVGYTVNKKGWLYSTLTVLVLISIMILMNLAGYFLTSEASFKSASIDSMSKNLLSMPLNAVIGLLAGFLGEKCRNVIKSKNKVS